jgi:quinol-cytochrome oxidoreductase complex cytochrome b subunit
MGTHPFCGWLLSCIVVQGWYAGAILFSSIPLLGLTTITEKIGSRISSSCLQRILGLTYLLSQFSQTIPT